jgi:hypothetical protein
LGDKIVEIEGTANEALTTADGKMSASAEGSYSWRFSSGGGITMWDGSKTDTNKVFWIDGTGLHMNGSGTFSGTITAKEGSIGDLKISDGVPDTGAPWNFSGCLYYNGTSYGAGGYDRYKVRLTAAGFYLKYGAASFVGIPWGLLAQMVKCWVDTTDGEPFTGGFRYRSDLQE